MLEFKKIIDDVFFVPTKDKHRPLFDNLMPLEEGTSYNAYIIKGKEKNVLIDTTYPPFIDDFVKILADNDIEKIDYIISLHAEQDHSGGLRTLYEKYPNAKIVTNQKCKEITQEFYNLKDEDYIIINDGDILDLGGKSLKFMFAPWVHWPETMFAYLQEDKILLSTDFFGAHATNFDKFWEDDEKLIPLLKGYYSEIMMPYAMFVKKHLAMVKNLSPNIIAPSHGPIFKKPNFVMDLYEKWSSDKKENRIVIIGVTMYGSTQKMIDYVKDKLRTNGIEVSYYDAVDFNSSDFAADLVDASGILVAAPTVLTGPHPAVVKPCYLANLIKPELKYIAVMGSYSWGGTMAKQTHDLLKNIKSAKLIEPVLAKGTPKASDYERLDSMVDDIVKLHN